MPRLKNEDELLGTVAASRYLGVGRSTLTSWRRRGEVRSEAVEDGRRGIRYKFALADLDEFRKRVDYSA
jgi:predicted site-specific integrase-resolvase